MDDMTMVYGIPTPEIKPKVHQCTYSDPSQYFQREEIQAPKGTIKTDILIELLRKWEHRNDMDRVDCIQDLHTVLKTFG